MITLMDKYFRFDAKYDKGDEDEPYSSSWIVEVWCIKTNEKLYTTPSYVIHEDAIDDALKMAVKIFQLNEEFLLKE